MAIARVSGGYWDERNMLGHWEATGHPEAGGGKKKSSCRQDPLWLQQEFHSNLDNWSTWTTGPASAIAKVLGKDRLQSESHGWR